MSDNLPVPLRPGAPLSPTPSAPDISGPNVLTSGPNALTLLLGRARTDSTRKAYANNVRWFFRDVYGSDPDAAAVRAFLSQSEVDMAMQLALYRQRMKDASASGATMNLRLTAIRALVETGHDFKLCAFGSKGLVYITKAQAYRDTRGPDMENVKRMLALPDRETLRGRRDFALLRLLADNALRRCEIGRLAVADFEPESARIAVLGKGQDEKVWVTLHPATVRAVREYLTAAGHTGGALFRNCAFCASAKGAALTDDGLYYVVRAYAAKIRLKLSPHKFRHFAITAALDQTKGDLLDGYAGAMLEKIPDG